MHHCLLRLGSRPSLGPGTAPGVRWQPGFFLPRLFPCLSRIGYRWWISVKDASTVATMPAMTVTTTEWVAR